MSVRKPPVKEVMSQYPQGVRGICCWCGGDVTEKTPERGLLKYWHDKCKEEFLVITNPQYAANKVQERDRNVCFDCGKIPERKTVTRIMGKKSGRTWEWDYEDIGWHVDHNIPLWKVSGLPPIDRIEYFKLDNLVTRCHECHAAKTKLEAKERAHFNRLLTPPKKTKKKIQPRGFQKTHKPMKANYKPRVRDINDD